MFLCTALSFAYSGSALVLLDSLESALFELRREGLSLVLFFGVKYLTVLVAFISVLCLAVLSFACVVLSFFFLFHIFLGGNLTPYMCLPVFRDWNLRLQYFLNSNDSKRSRAVSPRLLSVVSNLFAVSTINIQ